MNVVAVVVTFLLAVAVWTAVGFVLLDGLRGGGR